MGKKQTTEEILDYWQNFANAYENYFLKTTVQVNTLLIPLLNLHPSHTVAECGCGTGSGIQLLHLHFPTLTKILANDLSPEMLQRAQLKNFPNTEFFLANNEFLPYDSESCDRYISNLSMQAVVNPKNMLNEAYRVLKTNGLAVLSVWGAASENNLFVTIARANQRLGLDPPSEMGLFELNDQEKVNKMMAEAGFESVKSFFTAVPVLAKSAEEVVEIHNSRLEAQMLKERSLEMFERLAEAVRDEAELVFESGNFLSFDVLILVGEKN